MGTSTRTQDNVGYTGCTPAHTCDSPPPPLPLHDLEAYASQLVTNTHWDLQHLRQAAQHNDTDMKLATWKAQGAQGTLSLQRWANVLYLVRDRHRCGIQEYDPRFPLPEAATTALKSNYKCYAASGTRPRVASLAKNTMVP